MRLFLDILELGVMGAFAWGYNDAAHPPFWKMLLVTVPLAFVAYISMIFVGTVFFL